MLLRFALRLCVALATFLCGITITKVLPSFPAEPIVSSEAERQVLSVEREYVAAHLHGDVAALDRLLADDFTFTRPYGRVTDKADRLALVGDPYFAFSNFETDNTSVRVDGDKAYVTGQARVWVRRGSGCMRGEYVSPWYEYTRTFEQRAGRWQVVSTEVTRFAHR